QGSWAVTGLLFALPFVWGVSHLWFYVIAVIIVTPALHFVTNIAAYFLKLKDVWY
ncbi:MAG: CDP-archaeol synthase, partial [Candidatus Heimdallarchaeota archaeon]|nr:CDP-archaeol synthase [Candidatus Heimdallarchaeota archaeon]MCK5143816.1 CDP-archaeol synthase [Candidatus Heimdallarchaeota archaeon]